MTVPLYYHPSHRSHPFVLYHTSTVHYKHNIKLSRNNSESQYLIIYDHFNYIASFVRNSPSPDSVIFDPAIPHEEGSTDAMVGGSARS